MTKNKLKEKTPYELGSYLFSKYSTEKNDLSTTYKQRIKDKINEKNNHR